MRSYQVGWVFKVNDVCPCKQKDMWRHRHTQIEDSNLKKKAEIGMMQLQMKGHNSLQDNTEAKREARNGP